MWYVMMAPCDIHTFRELLLFTSHSEKEKNKPHTKGRRRRKVLSISLLSTDYNSLYSIPESHHHFE